MKTVQVRLASEDDTQRLGNLLAEELPVNCVVALNGPLGAGKTRLARALATACGVDEADVTSPTFTLWQTYEARRTIHHLDAYRIADEDEFFELGIEECFDAPAITLIEWAERIDKCLPAERLTIRLDVVSETERTAVFSSSSTELADICHRIAERWEG